MDRKTTRSHRRKSHAMAAAIVIAALVSACGGTESAKVKGTTDATAATAAPPATTSPQTRPAPTDAQVKQAFEAYINERANSGVMLAQSVTSVAVNSGVVTVTVDAKPAVLELSPFDNLAKFFGTPVAFNDDEGVWLRQTVQRVAVFDAAGNSLGSMTAAELNKLGAG
jgi:hypothetical protein